MLNKLLRDQVQGCLGKMEVVPAGWDTFLQAVSNEYDGLEKERDSKEKLIYERSEAIQELTVKLKSEAEVLKKAHDELGRILNSVNHGFFSRDISTDNYTYLSLACERIYGYSAEDFFANSHLWFDLIHPEDRSVVEQDNQRLANKEEVYTQYRIISKDKSVKWIELTIIPFFKDEKLTRVDGVLNDITKRKAAESEREIMMNELMKSNADLKQFSYITSHNLRSPLSNILGILNLFDFSDDEVHNKQMLDMLKVSAQQLKATIDDLTQILIIKNNVNHDPVSLDLKRSFDEVIQTFNSALHEIGGTVTTDFRSPFVMLNKVYLESIFINLISNAIKYRSPDRRLILDVASSEDEKGYVKIKFADNGIGIDLSRHKDKVFGLYQRFHDNIEGQGLGLYIMKTQIEATGGKIFIESEPGVGTTFILLLRR